MLLLLLHCISDLSGVLIYRKRDKKKTRFAVQDEDEEDYYEEEDYGIRGGAPGIVGRTSGHGTVNFFKKKTFWENVCT